MLVALVGLSLLVQMLAASPYIDNQTQAQVLRYELDTNNLPNSYSYSYDNSDGSSRTEHGAILNPDTKDATLDVQGSVRWYNSKGQLYEMIYKAGKRGYRTIIKKVS
ncbi:hypothetical protein O3G_MSEX005601 [Manduca sexta]|uniref:Uncharacterized protein n=1 Tax=Manduca sexta TaxID=7130 RepID=A0A922CJN4_MANSE|nr:hypothetical protein O3G_MSEX005601 [Manduca sexta]KAG6448613.1 hypothetical protein O3G_MSEX005601 [Manduca sexta]